MRRKTQHVNKPSKQDDIVTAEAGDYCYFLDFNNKVGFGKINRVFKEKETLCFDVMCQTEFRFYCVPYYFCSFFEKDLKKKKRSTILENRG